MQQKYDWPDKIPDEAIRDQFAGANEVSFSARRFNYIPHRYIAFGDLGWWLPLTRVLPLIGITPQALRPVFNHQRVMEWKYEDRVEYEVREVELPESLETYEQLGDFPLSDKPFQELAPDSQEVGKGVTRRW